MCYVITWILTLQRIFFSNVISLYIIIHFLYWGGVILWGSGSLVFIKAVLGWDYKTEVSYQHQMWLEKIPLLLKDRLCGMERSPYCQPCVEYLPKFCSFSSAKLTSLFCLLACLVFLSHSRKFRSYGNVTITGEWLQILTNSRHLAVEHLGHLRGPMTLIPIAKRLAMELSQPVFKT